MKLVIQTSLAVMALVGWDMAAAGENASQTSRTAYENIQWDVKPGGRKIAAVQGDYTQGKHIKLIHFGAGQKTAFLQLHRCSG